MTGPWLKGSLPPHPDWLALALWPQWSGPGPHVVLCWRSRLGGAAGGKGQVRLKRLSGGRGYICRAESSGSQGCWALRGQLTAWGQSTVEVPGVHTGVRSGAKAHPDPGSPRPLP